MNDNLQKLDGVIRCLDLISVQGRQEIRALDAAYRLLEDVMSDLATAPKEVSQASE